MMDIMRQHPLRKKKKDPEKYPETEKYKEGKGASIFAQSDNGDYKCSCCGSNKCRLHHCPKKKDLPPEKWYNTEYTKKKVEEAKVSTTTTTEKKVVVAQYLGEEEVSSDNDTKMVFSGAQIVRFEEEPDPEVIWDSGSTITLAKDELLLEDIKR